MENLLNKIAQITRGSVKGEPYKMKRAKSVAFLMAATSSLFLAMFAGTAAATYPGYSVTVYGGADSTLDGKWTTNTEWDDASIATPVIADDAYFRIKFTFFSDGTTFFVYDWYLVEFYSDNTNDPGDYVSICYDVSGDGGTVPGTSDIRIDYVGHNGTVKTYKGDGTAGWVPGTLVDVTVAQSMDVSKMWGVSHWITEFKIEKTQNGPGINNAIRVAVYDASNPSAGVKSWPPGTNINVPDNYGADPADTSGSIPEGIAFGAVVALSSVAGLVGSFFFRKRSKIGKIVAMP